MTNPTPRKNRKQAQHKKTLFEVMGQHQITLEMLSEHCDARCIWALQQGDPIDRQDAHSVIQALNTLAGTSRRLNSFTVCLCAIESSDMLTAIRGPHCFKHRS
ncbi:hypothetical protein [Ktedonobacter racemifer]|uniref:Uncharacterized protein n=1 Tax=Ktedonobacter racemifer DSM 44963 TaxID=485913 RepID=D6U3Y0_KTERA|nr:hypothetical protein [Ktedonobacter racemifer]EFH81218.1 hypothetical protein Krac_1920 [Ktedonobacter racemifer DSM 44963]